MPSSSPDKPRGAPALPRRPWRRVLAPVLLILILLGVLQLLSDTGLIQGFVLPAPRQVALSLVRDAKVILPHAGHTLRISLAGYGISTVLGLLFALMMDRFVLLSDSFYPLIVISQTIPTLVITPVIVQIFGYSDWARLVVVVLVCFFPVTINTLSGLRSVDPDLLRMMKTMGASKAQVLRHVKIPSSLPSFFAGLRISATYCVMAAVLAEWAGGGDGLGIYMLRTKRSFRFDAMFASIIWIVVLSLAFYLSAILLEKIAMPWKLAEKKGVFYE